VIAVCCFFYRHFGQAILVQQMPSQLRTATRVSVRRLGIALKHTLDPDTGAEYDGYYD
jgi:hypothetical protein